MNPQQLNDLLRPLMLPDLRTECRSRGVNPGGGRDALVERVRQHMLSTGNYTLAGQELKEQDKVEAPAPGNNYSRPEGQNVGNFLTDRNSSRIIHPPGGKSQINFGGDEPLPSPVKTKVTTAPLLEEERCTPEDPQLAGSPMASPGKHSFAGPASPIAGSIGDTDSPRIAAARSNNNYHRSEGQNVGNFMTNRNSSRVSAPPGGHSNITFG